jgi:preprotein translocase subunit YajC
MKNGLLMAMLVLMLPVFLWGMSYGESMKAEEIAQSLIRGQPLNLPGGIKVEVDRVEKSHVLGDKSYEIARQAIESSCGGSCHIAQ